MSGWHRGCHQRIYERPANDRSVERQYCVFQGRFRWLFPFGPQSIYLATATCLSLTQAAKASEVSGMLS